MKNKTKQKTTTNEQTNKQTQNKVTLEMERTKDMVNAEKFSVRFSVIIKT